MTTKNERRKALWDIRGFAAPRGMWDRASKLITAVAAWDLAVFNPALGKRAMCVMEAIKLA